MLEVWDVHRYEQTFWDLDIAVGPRCLRGFSTRKLKAWGLGRLGKDLELIITDATPAS
jgi:hypothetical protein